jgi:hypothetical protein
VKLTAEREALLMVNILRKEGLRDEQLDVRVPTSGAALQA